MNKLLIALIFLMSCQTKQDKQPPLSEQSQKVIQENNPAAFLSSADTIWMEVCDTIKDHIFFKKVKTGRTQQEYAGLFVDGGVASLWERKNGNWNVLDTISKGRPFISPSDCTLEIPMIEVKDFDGDGYEDLEVSEIMNTYGNIWSKIYLLDTVQKSLRQVVGLDDAPGLRFDRLSGLIASETVSGTYGISWEAWYQLKAFYAYPVKKIERDYSNMKEDGNGAILRIYKGNGKDWKLTKSVKFDIKDEAMILQQYGE